MIKQAYEDEDREIPIYSVKDSQKLKNYSSKIVV